MTTTDFGGKETYPTPRQQVLYVEAFRVHCLWKGSLKQLNNGYRSSNSDNKLIKCNLF
jgi:hypothetical protein